MPSAGRLRPLGIDEVRITGGFWGAPAERQRAPRPSPHIGARLESEGWLPNFDLAAAGELARRQARPRVLRLGDLQVPRGPRVGDRAQRRRRPRGAVPRARRAGRRGAGAGRLPQHQLRPRRSRARGGPTWSGATSCTASATSSRRRRAGAHPARRRRPARDRPARRRPGVRESSARTASRASAAIPRSRWASPSWRAPLGEPRYARAGAAVPRSPRHGTLADIEWGRSYYQDDVPVRDAEVLRGHAVRANYLAAGAVDVAVETGDAPLLDALRAAVGAHGRPAHVRHGRAGLAPPGRGLRRGLGAARPTAPTPRPARASARSCSRGG